jgi:hypothetical protein
MPFAAIATVNFVARQADAMMPPKLFYQPDLSSYIRAESPHALMPVPVHSGDRQ